MLKYRIEILISLIAIAIGGVVGTIGYFSHESLSKISLAIKEGTRPDNKVFLVKELNADLILMEQTVRFYVLTNNENDLQQFYSLEDSIAKKADFLGNLEYNDQSYKVLVDSFIRLTNQKINLWDEILATQISKQSFFPSFLQLYSDLGEQQQDSGMVTFKKTLPVSGSDSLKLTKGKTANKTLAETEIKRKIRKVEWELYKRQKQKNVLESKLVEENVVLNGQINTLIREIEKKQQKNLDRNSEEINQLADLTINQLFIYTVSAIILLVLALLIIFYFLRKSRKVSRILTDAREKAETLAEAKEQFAANVSHELRTPVNSIFGLAEQLKQKKLDTETAGMISVIYNSSSHLRNIVNDTLDFSKIQAQKLVPVKIEFSPEEVFKEIVSLFENEAVKKGISLDYKWEGDKPSVLVGDPFRLKQIVINLVGNAIKFTTTGRVDLKVRGSKKGDDFSVEIQVIDTGIGIEKDKIGLIFDEYVQLDNASGIKNRGTGLGLAIVKKLVELLEGRINFESTPGIGSRVTVSLTYKQGADLQTEPGKGQTAEIASFQEKTLVLIVDDEEYNRFLLKKIFTKWGVRFKEAKTGVEAVLATENEKFDVILMDLQMPEMHGLEATGKILAKNPETIIIAVSATNDEKEKKACFDMGMKGFLIKPFSETELYNQVSPLLQPVKTEKTSDPDYSLFITRFSELAGGDALFMNEMIGLFIQSVEKGVAEIEEAINSENLKMVSESAHRMAAPAKHISAEQLYSRIRQLEKDARENRPKDSVMTDFAGIKAETGELVAFLKLYLAKNKIV